MQQYLLLLGLLLLSLAWFLYSSRPSPSRAGPRSLLLVGPSSAGKSALFSRLLFGAPLATVTSVKENAAVLKNRVAQASSPPVLLTWPIELVDIPGHARLRTHALAPHLSSKTDTCVFVVDAAAGLSGKSIRETGEHLHVVLSLLTLLREASPRASQPKLLIFLNKFDLVSAPTGLSTPTKAPTTTASLTTRAKTSLERELDRRRVASSTSTSGSNAGARLDGLEKISVGASSSSALSSIRSLDALKEFLITLLAPSSMSVAASTVLPTDEAEVLSHDDQLFCFEGPFTWEKLSENSGVDVEWVVGSTKSEGGLHDWWQWIETSN